MKNNYFWIAIIILTYEEILCGFERIPAIMGSMCRSYAALVQRVQNLVLQTWRQAIGASTLNRHFLEVDMRNQGEDEQGHNLGQSVSLSLGSAWH